MILNGYQTRDGITTARQSQEKMDSARKCQDFSKAWEVGDKLSVFFPIVWSPYYENGEIATEQARDSKGKLMYDEAGEPIMTQKGRWDIPTFDCWGHNVGDMKQLNLGATFIPSNTEIYQGKPVRFERDENGNIQYDDFGQPIYTSIEGDVTYQFARIAPLFIRGQKQAELNKAYSNNFQSEEFRRKAISDIEDKYDTNKSFNAPKPIIGKVRLATMTEVVAVKMDKYDDPEVDKAANYIYRMSSEKIDELLSLVNDVKYKPRDLDQKWFEVQISFNGDSNDQKGRAAAGRKAHPVGLTEEYTTRSRNPEAFEKIRSRVESIPMKASIIEAHTFIHRIPEAKIKSALSYYMAQFGDSLDNLSESKDIEMMTNNALYLIKFAALDSMSAENLKDKIMDSYKEYLSEHPEVKSSLELASEADGYSAPDTDAQQPSIKDLLGGDSELELPEEESIN